MNKSTSDSKISAKSTGWFINQFSIISKFVGIEIYAKGKYAADMFPKEGD